MGLLLFWEGLEIPWFFVVHLLLVVRIHTPSPFNLMSLDSRSEDSDFDVATTNMTIFGDPWFYRTVDKSRPSAPNA